MDDSEKAVESIDSLDYLRRVVADEEADPKLRVRAAVALAQYEHTKTHDGGKKEATAERSREVAKGKFAPSAPPKLAASNGKVVNG